MIVFASDHGGYELKEKLKDYISKKGLPYIDVGAKEFNQKDDYPDFAKMGAIEVLKDETNIGIFLCGSGIGVCMVANRFKGIRAVRCEKIKPAVMARRHENANVLCLGSSYINMNYRKAIKIIDAFLNTNKDEDFERHKRRLSKF